MRKAQQHVEQAPREHWLLFFLLRRGGPLGRFQTDSDARVCDENWRERQERREAGNAFLSSTRPPSL